jgi:hypothetical protein
MFQVNQIVRGVNAGVFVILGFRLIDGESYAQLKAVNPKNHTETFQGEMALPVTSLRDFE